MSAVDTVARIEKVAVVGAGNMGSGIAQKIATEGYPVVLLDVSEDAAQRGLERLRATLDEGVERKIFSAAQSAEILGRIQATSDMSAASDVDLAIEAVFEDPGVKKEVFDTLDGVCKPSTILATNTSSLYVRDLAAATQRPDRFLGLHYFYHPAKNRLVEVVAGSKTHPDLYALVWRFQEIIGKTPIRCADAAGFVVNRYFVPWLNEAVRLLEEGVADVPTIEHAAKQGFRIGMGPFELMNVTGVPIALHAASTLGRELGAFYQPSPRLAEQVESGALWALTGEPDEAKTEAVVDRLLGVTFLVAGQLIDEQVCTMEDADIGARVGLRWSRGPFELMNRAGIEASCALAQTIADRWQLELPRALAEQRTAGRPFTFELVRYDVADGVATITLNRPDAMNALNVDVIEQLGTCVDRALADEAVRGIVLAGAGKAFVAGADIRFFVRHMKAGNLGAIRTMTEAGQSVFRAIDRSRKTVVVKLDGLSLGGGAELALCADYIVATPRGSLGFPETGIGIYPGLGGTQRLRLRVGAELTQYLIMTGDIVPADRARTMGLVDDVVDAADIESVARTWALERSPVTDRPPAAVSGFETERAFFSKHTPEAVIAGEVTPRGADEERLVRKVSSKAPVAVRIAADLIRKGSEVSLDEGLAMELSHLEEIFSTDDALTGLSMVGRGRPEFQGH